MTNQINKAREAFNSIIDQGGSYSNNDGTFSKAINGGARLHEDVVKTILSILTTLSSIDAERLTDAIEHVRKLDREMRHNQVYPPSYTMSVPVNKEEDSDYRIKMVCDVAATLHGLVRGE